MMNTEKFAKTEQRFQELERLLADLQVLGDQAQYQKIAKEYSDITPVVTAFQAYRKTIAQIAELKSLLEEKHDREFEALAKSELEDLQKKEKELSQHLEDLANPKPQEKDRNLIMEVRAGTGGEEASLFAADLYRMYTKYAESRGWKVELMRK